MPSQWQKSISRMSNGSAMVTIYQFRNNTLFHSFPAILSTLTASFTIWPWTLSQSHWILGTLPTAFSQHTVNYKLFMPKTISQKSTNFQRSTLTCIRFSLKSRSNTRLSARVWLWSKTWHHLRVRMQSLMSSWGKSTSSIR